MENTWQSIQQIAADCGAKYPQLVAAQWALESAWGKSVSGKNNFFGIKGKGTKVPTTEFINGVETRVYAEFKDFDTPKDCIQYLVDRWYKDFEGYKGVDRAPSVEKAAQSLVDQGYATDPNYASKLINLVHSNSSSATTTLSSNVVAPKKKPQDIGFRPGDHHVVVNGAANTAKAYDYSGKLLWEVECLAKGQIDDYHYRQGNTPPGLYKIGAIYRDYERMGASPSYDRTLMAYGWYSFDLVELENQEAGNGRAGIMVHGGGSACGWPGAWQPMQELYTTYGCVRMHNQDLRDKLLPITRAGTTYVSVYQLAA